MIVAVNLNKAALSVAAAQIFPREHEGNIYSVNWSLCEDGVVPVGNAYRNARTVLLKHRVGIRGSGEAKLAKPVYFGSFTVTEAGDTITHDNFKAIFDAQKDHFESGIDLFVEDAGLGAAASYRVGARFVSDNAAVALIARRLMVISE